MSLILACKAFFKALKDPKQGKLFVEEKPEAKALPAAEAADYSHLRLLAILQNSSRLIDFLKEDIAGFADAQVGAAIRQIHQECAKSLEDLVTIRPVLEENEGAAFVVTAGYDPLAIKVIGNVKGAPPYTGEVVHKGWKAHKKSLPKQLGDKTTEIICPAEIEIR